MVGVWRVIPVLLVDQLLKRLQTIPARTSRVFVPDYEEICW